MLYKSKRGDKILVKTPFKPKRTRVFKAAGGLRKYRAVKATTTTKEVLIMAKTAKKSKKDEIEDKELEALAELDNLDDDEPAEKPKGKKGKKGAAKGKAATNGKTKAKPAKDGVGTADLANAAGTDGRTLRMYLRKAKIEKDEDQGRYWWPSLDDPEAKKIIKAVKGGAADEAKKESLQRLKDSKAAKDKKAGKGKKKNKKKNKK